MNNEISDLKNHFLGKNPIFCHLKFKIIQNVSFS